ncbi:hypothetical protein V8C42DRAFT_298971 [Trichoderma barbatum]
MNASPGNNNIGLPFEASTTRNLGRLSNTTSHVPINVDLQAIINRGIFQSNDEWKCYRRRPLSCICSYSLSTPDTSGMVQFLPTNSKQLYNVYHFAMSVSAVVAKSDPHQHTVELVHRTSDGFYQLRLTSIRFRFIGMSGSSQSQTRLSSKYTFEDLQFRRVTLGNGKPYTFEDLQFRRATLGNGKPRAEQQHVHLVVELWAYVGIQHGDKFIKVADKTSARIIVIEHELRWDFSSAWERLKYKDHDSLLVTGNSRRTASENDNVSGPEGTSEGLFSKIKSSLWVTGISYRMYIRYIYWAFCGAKLFRPKLKPGYRRIEWTCDCGARLYGDFVNDKTSNLDALELSLQAPAEGTSTSNSSDSEQSVRTQANPRHMSSRSSSSSRTALSTGSTDASSIDIIQPRYLALCIDTGGIYKTLAELDTSPINSDGEAFLQMKKAYLQYRGVRSRLHFLIKPVTVEFVRFTLWNLRRGYV